MLRQELHLPGSRQDAMPRPAVDRASAQLHLQLQALLLLTCTSRVSISCTFSVRPSAPPYVTSSAVFGANCIRDRTASLVLAFAIASRYFPKHTNTRISTLLSK
jgi:hypothetical protein